MGSKTKKLKVIRKKHHSPNTANVKADIKRTAKNREVLRELAAKEGA